MKKCWAFILAASLMLSLVACGGGGGDSESTETSTEVSTEEPAENPYADMELCAEYAITKLKSILKNPSSLIVNNLYAVETDDSYIFDIDYTAENGFGGSDRDDFFISVCSEENGFAVHTYGSESFEDAENQMYSSQLFDQYNKVSGFYVFDPETITVMGIDESGIDSSINQRVQLKGKMYSEREKAGDGYSGIWNFDTAGSSVLQVVSFAEGIDLDWYKNFTGNPYEITISAIKEEDNHYRDAEIVEDSVRDASNDVRLRRFNYNDRICLALVIPDSEMEPMSTEEMQAVFTDATFSMREGESEDELNTITFHADGTVSEKDSEGQECDSLYDYSWRIEDGDFICTSIYINSLTGEESDTDRHFSPYQLDETRYLLIGTKGLLSSTMILTQQ